MKEKKEKGARPFTWKLGVAYGLPNYGLALMIGPAMGILHGYLAKNFGLTLTAIGLVFILARVFDAVTDPLVGIASDKLRHRFWGRRSWVVAGILLSVLSMYFVMNKSEVLTKGSFCFWMLLSFLAWTVAQIPYLAWGTEIADSYNSRTKLFSYMAAWGYIGSMIYLVLPVIISAYQIYVLNIPKELTSLDYSPLSMKVSFWMLAIMMPLGVIIALLVCPDGSHIKTPVRRSLSETFHMLVTNKAMLIFTSAFILLGLAGGMQIGMAYLHLSVYLQVENTSTIYFFAFISSLIGVAFWNWFANRKEKHIAFAVGLAITVPFFIALALLNPSTGEQMWMGQSYVFWQYMVIICALNFCQVVYIVLPPAILGDIARSDMVKSRTDDTSTYYSIYTFSYKAVLGVGQGLALLMAGAVFHFNPESKIQTPLAVTGLKLFMGYLPAILAVSGVLVMLRYPITKKVYAEVERKLKEMDLLTD